MWGEMGAQVRTSSPTPSRNAATPMAEFILPDSVLLLQAHLKAEILLALGPALGSQATWSKARVPTLTDVSSLLALV